MSSGSKKARKIKKEQERLKKAQAREARMKNPGGGSDYAAKERRIAKGDQERFADNPNLIVEESQIGDDLDFEISDLFADIGGLAEEEVEPSFDPDIHHRPYSDYRESGTKLIVSESYDGAGGATFYFMDEYIYPSNHPEARTAPCFLVAEEDSKTGLWQVTRFVGCSHGDEKNPVFEGEKEIIFKASERYGHKREEMAYALRAWCNTQPDGYLSKSQNLLFGYAPKIDPNSDAFSYDHKETRIIYHDDVRFRNTSGIGMGRRDHRP